MSQYPAALRKLNKYDWQYFSKVLIVIFLAAFLRCFMLTNQSLWFDEGSSLEYSSSQEALSRLAQSRRSENFQPLYFLILQQWREVFGDSEVALRSLSVICGLGALILFFAMTINLFGRRQALWALIILSTSSFMVYYCQEVRPYGLLFLLCALQLYSFTPALANQQSGKFIWKLLFGAITGIAIFGSVFMVLFSAALAFSHLLVYRNRRHWLSWWVPAALFSLPALWFYASSPAFAGLEGVRAQTLTQPIIQNLLFVPYGVLAGTTFGPPLQALRGSDRIQIVLSYWPQLSVLAAVLGGLVWSLSWILMKRFKEAKVSALHSHAIFILLLGMSFLLSTSFALITKQNWQPRHSFFLLFPLAILLSTAFRDRFGHGIKYRRIVTWSRILVIALVLINFYSLFNYYFDPRYSRDDYRSAASNISSTPGIPTALLWGNPLLLEYYGSGPVIDGRHLRKKGLAQELTKLTNRAPIVRIVINRPFYWGNGVSLEHLLRDFYTRSDHVAFTDFDLYKFEYKTTSAAH